MAVESTLLKTPGTDVPDKRYIEPDSNATGIDDITGANNSELFMVEIDCTGNPDQDVYAKFYNHADPDIGTTDAEVVLRGYKGKKVTYTFRQIDIAALADNVEGWHGWIFATAISFATVQEAGGTGGATAPSGKVKVTLGVKD